MGQIYSLIGLRHVKNTGLIVSDIFVPIIGGQGHICMQCITKGIDVPFIKIRG